MITARPSMADLAEAYMRSDVEPRRLVIILAVRYAHQTDQTYFVTRRYIDASNADKWDVSNQSSMIFHELLGDGIGPGTVLRPGVAVNIDDSATGDLADRWDPSRAVSDQYGGLQRLI